MSLMALGGIILSVSAGGIGLFAIYPFLIRCACCRVPSRKHMQDSSEPFVSILVAVRNGEALLESKIANNLALDYPQDRIQHLFVSDGSTDRTVSVLRAHEASGIEVLELDDFGGKIVALNAAVPHCRGDIILFSDADAMPQPDALRILVSHFEDQAVGGVCGKRVICDDADWADSGQSAYITYDSKIKSMESRLGSVTSNDGKFYAIRRSLYQPIPDAVTDDLFVCLSVVHQKFRFRFEPNAIVNIRLPSRSKVHEFQRRRRIVSTSLRGILYHRELLNPFQFGLYAFQLFINKIVRRLLPFCSLGLLLGGGLVAFDYPILRLPVLCVVLAGGLALLWPANVCVSGGLQRLVHSVDAVHYLSLGQIGMMCGVIDFICGRRVIKWEPNKGNAVEGA